MPDLPDNLNQRQQDAIIALLDELTVAKAAERLDIAESTLYRWLRDSDFARAYRDARRESFRHASSLTQRYAPLAVNTLAKILTDAEAAHSAKVSAAVAMVRFGREAIELDDLIGRVETLELATDQGQRLSYTGRNGWSPNGA